jgi:6-phosphofructokinase 2
MPTMEETREDFTIFEEATRQQYRFVLPGARLREEEWQECLDELASLDPKPNFIVASGSLPPGVPEDFFGRVASVAKASGAKVVVDTSGPPLKAALLDGVYLIKPNLREFRELTGARSSDDQALIEAGRSLIAQGFLKLIALTLGSEGALLISEHRALRANGLPIRPASVVGAGDSFLAAMVFCLAKQDSLEIALKYGVAAGSAALLNPGTELCRSEDVQRLVEQVCLRPNADHGPGV